MYRELQVHHSLFSITEQELQLFQHHAAHYVPNDSINTALTHSTLDNWSTVFNIWLLFYKEKPIMLDYNKMMAYRSNFYCLELLTSHTTIKRYLQKHATDQTHFLIAYYLAEQLLSWVYNILHLHPEGKDILHKNLTRHYYLLEAEQAVTSNPLHEVYKEQRLITALMVADYAQHPTFEQHIRQALSLAKQHWVETTIAD